MVVHGAVRRWLPVAAGGFVVAFVAQAAWADIALPPKPKESQKAVFVVRHNNTEVDSKLVIPRRFLPSLGRAIVPEPPPAPTSPRASLLSTPIHLGTLLSVVISGGLLAVVFVRQRRVGSATMILAGMLTLTVLIGTAFATRTLRSTPSNTNPPTNAPRVWVETVAGGNEIVLILGSKAPATQQ
jgi:hypothetical protein